MRLAVFEMGVLAGVPAARAAESRLRAAVESSRARLCVSMDHLWWAGRAVNGDADRGDVSVVGGGHLPGAGAARG
ncbi:hypothetical protein GCM10008956_00590 [Deinococcus arenae]|uniref:Uncharacterized protein n=1 Tax=Deinococcus arenae TaxID=1452751 RepID=A0A8H9L3N8_9DEIO|nr:hypothetical protein GCM10008956_00590 [Deinococcus arenae]